MFTFNKFAIRFTISQYIICWAFAQIGHEAESINNMENQVKINIYVVFFLNKKYALPMQK